MGMKITWKSIGPNLNKGPRRQISLTNMDNTNGCTITKSKPKYIQSNNLSNIQREVILLLCNCRSAPLSLFSVHKNLHLTYLYY